MTQFETIQDYVLDTFQQAQSGEFTELIEHAKEQERLGFKNSKLNKKVVQIADFLGEEKLSKHYAKQYPGHIFLPWTAIHAVRINLDIALDSAEFYQGAVPTEQLEAISKFDKEVEVDKNDKAPVHEFLTKIADAKTTKILAAIMPVIRAESEDEKLNACRTALAKMKSIIEFDKDLENRLPYFREDPKSFQKIAEQIYEKVVKDFSLASKGYLMLAPKASFTTGQIDMVKRMQNLANEMVEAIAPVPRDPLVLKMVKGGALVVAAWGDEAEELNNFAESVSTLRQ